MLPNEPGSSAADRGPSVSPSPAPSAWPSPESAPPTPTDPDDESPSNASPADTHATQPTPMDPTVDPPPVDPPPVVVPVTLAHGERRRGWPFAVSMVLVAVMAGGALFLSGYQLGADAGTVPGSVSERDAWQPFWDVYNSITSRYPLEPVDRKTLIQGAIRGMVEAVGDPYSSYLTPTDYTGSLDDISGQFEGIGAEIGTVDAAGNTSDCTPFGENCFLVVIAPIEGSPAEAAGLKPGDVILEVDGSRLDGLTPDEARDRVRGEAGTEVKLHIVRYEAPGPAATPGPTADPAATPGPGGSAAPPATPQPRAVLEDFELTLVRARIQRREVSSRELAGGTVGYVRLSGFSDAGADELEAAIKAQLDKGIRKVVLDLRGNPGGFITAAREVASEFIPSGPVFWERDAQGNDTVTEAEAGGVATDASVRVVVLIDRGTASAAEIVAGALQDRRRAQLIGETSFGKGTVQEWIELGEVGGVKLTVWKWLTPDKRWIHKTGLTPDVPVEVPADTPADSDPVLDRALEVLAAETAAPLALLKAA